MTRKDYERIAAAVKWARTDIAENYGEGYAARMQGAYIVAEWLVKQLAADNPRFDRERFLAACGVTE